FHVDKLSSAHVYLRLPDRADGVPAGAAAGAALGAALSWDALPEALLADCTQLVKANSIEDMAVGQIPFKRDKNVRPSPPPSSLFLVSKLKSNR
ncbi:hypothetical protein DFH11DRAFT_1575430, partial [Phellopilus nigrolimitatus]